MKVVLFCGGLGTRLREYSETIPKPLVNIGYRPIVWHLMKYYAHFGHNEFILCLGHRGDRIREYFLNYNECMTNDFVISNGGRSVELFSRDMDNWRITFVETGQSSNIAQRLQAVRKYIQNDEYFLANYSDGLSDLPLNDYITRCKRANAVAGLVTVRSAQSFHSVDVDGEGRVVGINPLGESDLWLNGGFFILHNTIFDYIREGEELVEEPFYRLIEEKKLFGYRYSGFWKAMDTFKDKMAFDEMHESGDCPWEVWKHERPNVEPLLPRQAAGTNP